MIPITPAQVTPTIRSLFQTNEMGATRCFTVLEGSALNGKILVDNLADPRWGLVQETVDNSLFLGGNIDAVAFTKAFAELRQEGDILIGMPPGDPGLPTSPQIHITIIVYWNSTIGRLGRVSNHTCARCPRIALSTAWIVT